MDLITMIIDSITNIFSGGGSGSSTSGGSERSSYTYSGYSQVDRGTIEAKGETFSKGWDGNYHSNSWFSNKTIETDLWNNPKTDIWGNPIIKDD
jgi:hypothetical protein